LYYTEECNINYYKDTLIFNVNSSVEEIAKELASYDIFGNINFKCDNVNHCINTYANRTYQSYAIAINNSIDDYNDLEKKQLYCM